MNQNKLISILHVILLMMTVIGLKNHVTILPPLINEAGRDAWMSVFWSAIVLLPWLLMIIYLHRQIGEMSFRDWLSERLGTVWEKIIIYLFVVYLMIMAAFTLRETMQWVTVTFLPGTPELLLVFIYIVLCVFLAATGVQGIVIVNVIVLAGVVFLGFFVAFVNIKVKEYELLLPFLEHGIAPVLRAGIYPASGFVELFFILLIQSQIKARMKWRYFAVIVLILLGLTLGPLIGAITEFGPVEAKNQYYPAYEEWRLASIGRFVEHVDFFSIYQWLTGAFMRIGFIIFIVIHLLRLDGQRKRIFKSVLPAFLAISLPLFLFNDRTFLQIKSQYFLVSTFVFFFVWGIILTLVSLKKTKKMPKKKVEQ
ncbi:GerAB/ArcD/ProY family transporter [Metasolibacillus meyeri]|uniref:GerAB/ArcD/ProY family transporter n=1 Tax=Metasolibacillus meyeri TaxID=1071052 RepID=UPI000D31C650|nr:endospore germination permease [Metasolibacillus meyeri]